MDIAEDMKMIISDILEYTEDGEIAEMLDINVKQAMFAILKSYTKSAKGEVATQATRTCKLMSDDLGNKILWLDILKSMQEIISEYPQYIEDRDTKSLRRDIMKSYHNISSTTAQYFINIDRENLREDDIQDAVSEFAQNSEENRRLKIDRTEAAKNIVSSAQNSKEPQIRRLRYDMMEAITEIISMATQIFQRTESFKTDLMKAIEEIISMSTGSAVEVETGLGGNANGRMRSTLTVQNSRSQEYEVKINKTESMQLIPFENLQNQNYGKLRIEIEETI